MYGAAALTLNPIQKLTLLANIDGVLAEEELRNNPWGKGLSHDAFYDLILAATGDASEAKRKTKARRAAMVAADVESV